jgi:m7GpppX diphosphatase
MFSKWDLKTLSSLYLSAILHRHDLSSIRDLNESHIPLLQNIQRTVIHETTSRWPEINADQLRIFFHCTRLLYITNTDHPSYYHLHIHIVHTDFQGGDGMAVGKAWLLDDVIEQLSFLGPEGFKRKTITVIVGEESDLWKRVYSKLLQS